MSIKEKPEVCNLNYFIKLFTSVDVIKISIGIIKIQSKLIVRLQEIKAFN